MMKSNLPGYSRYIPGVCSAISGFMIGVNIYFKIYKSFENNRTILWVFIIVSLLLGALAYIGLRRFVMSRVFDRDRAELILEIADACSLLLAVGVSAIIIYLP